MCVFLMYIMCLIIFEEKVEVQDQYPLNLNPDQKAYDPIQDRYRSIGPMLLIACKSTHFLFTNIHLKGKK